MSPSPFCGPPSLLSPRPRSLGHLLSSRFGAERVPELPGKTGTSFCGMVNLASGATVQDKLLFLGAAADLRSQKTPLLLLRWENAPQNSPKRNLLHDLLAAI